MNKPTERIKETVFHVFFPLYITFKQLKFTALLLDWEDLIVNTNITLFSVAVLLIIYVSPEFHIEHCWLLWYRPLLCYCLQIYHSSFGLSSAADLDLSQCCEFIQQFVLLHSALPPSAFLCGHSPGLGSDRLWAPAQKTSPKSPDTFTHFLRLFAFHMDRQLHFTGIILDGNILIMPVNCQRSTLSSIISDSFEFLLAASTHKFH